MCFLYKERGDLPNQCLPEYINLSVIKCSHTLLRHKSLKREIPICGCSSASFLSGLILTALNCLFDVSCAHSLHVQLWHSRYCTRSGRPIIKIRIRKLSLSLARLPFLVFYQLTKMVMRKAPDMAIKFPTSPFANLCNILMLSVVSACSSWRLQHPLESSSYIHDHTPTDSALVQLHSILSMTIPMTATFSLCSPTKLDSCKSDNC